ncbi:hypothetical protein B0F90DRAFT_1917521 [Multifurca ochricompacta]|uniref:CLASP N-terminal domain-containing protein n=1 Tax=Multifurca ochricompacta TaxID=376703 RepID=A0AAD4M3L8_9AGAM|nr:hypothetical protein B0F90DRAFT_1917521 [Multifurca ochricompacta]
MQTIIDQTQLISLLPYFVGALRDKSVTLRLIAIECVLACVQCFNPPDLEKDARAKDMESAIKLTSTDASADVRKVSRSVFEAYKILLPARVESFAAPLSPTMKKYLNIDIPSTNSRPQSSQSAYTLPTTRPTSSMASAPPKRVEPHPRPATSMAHHRSTSSSALASSAPLGATAPKLTRSQTEHHVAQPNGQSAQAPLSKRRDDMPPPAIIPQRRPQTSSEPQAPPERPILTRRLESNGTERPAGASSSRTTAQILRPESTQPPVALKKSHTGPLRAETMTIKERLLGGAQRVPLPELQQQPPPPPPPPPRPILPQEKKAPEQVSVVPKRSRLDSVRHGPKSSAAMDAKRAVTQVSAPSSVVPGRSETSVPTPADSVAERRDISRPTTEMKKDDSRHPSSMAGKKGISKATSVRAEGKEIVTAGQSASDRPKSSMSTRSIGKAGQEPKSRKQDIPKVVPPMAGAGEKKEKPSQPVKGVAPVPTLPQKKVPARTGGVTQPTLSQLARMKAAKEEKQRRDVAKGPTKPLAIRPKSKAVPQKTTSKEVEIPAAAIMTPLPPSPEVRPADVPLPVSPVSARLGTENEQAEMFSANDTRNAPLAASEQATIPTTTAQMLSPHPFGVVALGTATKTPISALVSSIQRGFLFSPNSPLSPAQPDAEWECPAWPGLALNMGEEPSFEGVEESTTKRPLLIVGTDMERRTLTSHILLLIASVSENMVLNAEEEERSL